MAKLTHPIVKETLRQLGAHLTKSAQVPLLYQNTLAGPRAKGAADRGCTQQSCLHAHKPGDAVCLLLGAVKRTAGATDSRGLDRTRLWPDCGTVCGLRPQKVGPPGKVKLNSRASCTEGENHEFKGSMHQTASVSRFAAGSIPLAVLSAKQRHRRKDARGRSNSLGPSVRPSQSFSASAPARIP